MFGRLCVHTDLPRVFDLPCSRLRDAAQRYFKFVSDLAPPLLSLSLIFRLPPLIFRLSSSASRLIIIRSCPLKRKKRGAPSLHHLFLSEKSKTPSNLRSTGF